MNCTRSLNLVGWIAEYIHAGTPTLLLDVFAYSSEFFSLTDDQLATSEVSPRYLHLPLFKFDNVAMPSRHSNETSVLNGLSSMASELTTSFSGPPLVLQSLFTLVRRLSSPKLASYISFITSLCCDHLLNCPDSA